VSLKEDTKRHLLRHHQDFENFAQAMVESHRSRFDGIFWAFLESYLPESVENICDFGTGPGLLLRDLKFRFPSAHIVGVEAQPEMLKKLREIVGDEFDIFAADLAHPPVKGLEPARTDLIVCSMVLHELLVPTQVIKEMARVLRPGGVALIYDWIRQDLSEYSGGVLPTEERQFSHFSEHCRYTPQDLAWLFEQCGFEVKEWMARHNGRHLLLSVVRKG
jgi:SAM-dependent methyltransferase